MKRKLLTGSVAIIIAVVCVLTISWKSNTKIASGNNIKKSAEVKSTCILNFSIKNYKSVAMGIDVNSDIDGASVSVAASGTGGGSLLINSDDYGFCLVITMPANSGAGTVVIRDASLNILQTFNYPNSSTGYTTSHPLFLCMPGASTLGCIGSVDILIN